MGIGSKGQGLIFLISQPRAGSTMLQRILGCHPDVHTVSEPWVMLPPLRVVTDKGNLDGVEMHFARENVHAFLKTFPRGNDEYFEGLRRMYVYVYDRALESSGKRYFLDKTPRYAYLIPELCQTFPEANFIILFRNPLAVLCSIVETWTGYDPQLLSRHVHRDDLLSVPFLLLEGLRVLAPKCITVHYEQLVSKPEAEVKKVCEQLGLNYSTEMIEYDKHGLPRWHFGDQEIYRYTKPEVQEAERWRSDIRHPRMWKLANDYMRLLGRETVERMGYSYNELEAVLKKSRPHRVTLWFSSSMLGESTQSLHRFLHKPWSEKVRTIRSHFGRIIKLE